MKTDEVVYSDKRSNCCDAWIYDNTDICSKCGEHCEALPDIEEFYLDDIIVGGLKGRFKIKVYEYEPGRPAPACSNPSHPAYSDPGDPGTLDYDAWFVVNEDPEMLVKIPDHFDNLTSMLESAVWQAMQR
jgi:hypothetical protein